MTTSNNVIRGTTKKPIASESLAKFFENTEFPTGGQLFIGYPITTAADGQKPIDAVYVSPTTGVVVFDIVEGTDLGDYEATQDDIATRLEVKLKQHPTLVKKRNLLMPIHTVTYAPAFSNLPKGEYSTSNDLNLRTKIEDFKWDNPSDELYLRTVSALQSITSIRRSHLTRGVTKPDSRGAKLQKIENSIATLDAQQSHAVIETVDGVQSIRGLAGSGKTIVLALKAAYLHAQHPDWKLAVTFNTRSLRAQFKHLINVFTIEQAQEEPNWENVHIIQAWGAPGGGNRDGLYHQFCIQNDATYHDFSYAKNNYGSTGAFAGVCKEALAESKEIRPFYDAILIDEAQDLPIEFLQICYNMLKDPKRLVYAYDELQTLSGHGLPPAEEIFGRDENDNPLVSLSTPLPTGGQRDIILEKCYRNPRQVLVTAHALGFGVYRTPPQGNTTGLVQIFEDKKLWDDIGYRVLDGDLADNTRVQLGRDVESSPYFLEQHSEVDDLLNFQRFENKQEQATWVANQIRDNLYNEELTFRDIVVINPDPFTTRKNLGLIRAKLLEHGINSHIAGVDVGADIFFMPDRNSITFTGIYRAKGNEAGMVYITDAQESFESASNMASIRNRLFTAITRSKAWVRVCGVGPEMSRLIEEYEKIQKAAFTLDFRYPTEDERAKLQVLHRTVSKVQQRKIQSNRIFVTKLLEDLESGDVYPEDLDRDLLQRLTRALGENQ